MSTVPPRTQAERRSSTIARLTDATIDALAEVGYARTTVAEICRRADLSQGAIFRHFDTRAELIAHAVGEISNRHVEAVTGALEGLGRDSDPGDLALLVRDLCRTGRHAAWHEVMVVARTDEDLADAVRGGLGRFEETLTDLVSVVGTAPDADEARTVVLSLLHMFDSEAVTVRLWPNPEVEQQRLDWAGRVLSQVLTGS